MSQRGFYSLIQYQPDACRAEAVNVGVLIWSNGKHVVRWTSTLARCDRLFRMDTDGLDTLKSWMDGMAERLRRETFATIDDLTQFAASRANTIRITPPRLIVMHDESPDAAVERLRVELVEEPRQT